MRKNYFLSLFLLMTAFWHVQATDGSKSTNPSGNIASTTLFAAPIAPTSLSGTAVGGTGTRINLTWTDNTTDETEYEIAYSANPSSYTFTSTGIASSGTGTFQLTNLQPATTYYIWVRAIKSGSDVPTCMPQTNEPPNTVPSGKSASCWSNGTMVSTNDNLPGAVTSVIIPKPFTPRKTIVTFMDNSTNETSFHIERSTGGDFSTLEVIGGFTGTGRRSYEDKTTLPNTSYRYRVSARNATGVTLPEAVSELFTTLPDPPLPPNSLGNFGIGLNSVNLFWINAAFNATGFLIQQSIDNINWVTVGTNPPDNRGFVVQNLNEGQTYFFRVIAFNEGGNSVPSEVYPVTTLKRVAPNPSFNLVAKTVSTNQIDLTWNLGTQDDVTNNRIVQEIYRSSISGTEGFVSIAVIGDSESKYSDKTALPKTKYWYRIASINFQGQSPNSNVASTTTLGPPFSPSNLTAVLVNDALGNTIIKTDWKDNSNDEWGFTLERSADSTFTTGVLKADLDSNTVSAASIPIEEGVTYYFRINASNKFGNSKYSPITKLEVPVTVIPNAPYDLKGTATAADISLKWGDDSNKETAFDVERSLDGTTFTKIGSTRRNEVTYIDKTVSEKTKYFYRVRATNIKGNSGYTNVLTVTTLAKASASIDIIADDIFQVYPNPTADAVKVSVSENMLKESGVILITDKTNRVISKTILAPNQSEYRLDLSNYSEGTYTISLRTATQQITKRVYKF